MKTLSKVALSLVLVSSVALSAASAPADEVRTAAASTGGMGDPAHVVDRLHVALLDVMKQADALGYQGRFDQLAPVLDQTFDLPFMAQKSVGRHWKNASEQDRHMLVQTFTRFSIANYAGRFDAYSGQSFETLDQAPSTHGTILVKTRLNDPGGELVRLNYRLRPVDGGWKIIDVYLNGTVSELALRRSEYSSLIKREGFKALLVALDERIDTLAAIPADQAS